MSGEVQGRGVPALVMVQTSWGDKDLLLMLAIERILQKQFSRMFCLRGDPLMKVREVCACEGHIQKLILVSRGQV